jgi:hypothetical protein
MKRIQLVLLVVLTTAYFSFAGGGFDIITATKSTWGGGKPGAAGGENYYFKLVAKKPSSKMKINELWIGDEKIEIERVIRMGGQGSAIEFNKKDTIEYKAKKTVAPLTNRIGPKAEKQEKTGAPIAYEGAALIGYTVKGKQKYMVVESFEVEKSTKKQ